MNAVFLHITIFTALACGLALFMIIADFFIGDYGQAVITVNNSKKLEVEAGSTLLSVLKGQKIFIPSACGGRGSCGLCKVKIISGAGDYLATELPWISADEKKSGIRLSCQVKVRRNLEIEIPESLFNIHEYRARVESIRNLTYDIKEIKISLPEEEQINFKAGQFMQIETPVYELTAQPVYRAYSIASSPGQKNSVEFEIRLVPGGICTTYIHKHLKIGDTVTLNGPYGDFFVRPGQKKIIFIAGGSGMAPIKSMLADMVLQKNTRQAVYFFGARTQKDLFLTDEIRTYENRLAFRFIPALSSPEPGWKGESGLITEVVDRYIQNGPEYEAYLCGSPGMINACVSVLVKKGVSEKEIYFDKFG
ncbi:MAG: oxidoreductase [Spirochaetes bacterium GWF1_41_5]|nr:MAG: oxidoreductase [Spirochaetes bacterium GWF1_41_5]